MRCEWCRANLDDLSGLESASELESVITRVGALTLQLLRSRTHGGATQ
jgi:hypothetical protein